MVAWGVAIARDRGARAGIAIGPRASKVARAGRDFRRLDGWSGLCGRLQGLWDSAIDLGKAGCVF